MIITLKKSYKLISLLMIVVGFILLIIGGLTGGHFGVFIQNGKIEMIGNEKERQINTVSLNNFKDAKIDLQYCDFEIVRGSELKVDINVSGNLQEIEVNSDNNGKLVINHKKTHGINNYRIGFGFVVDIEDDSKVTLHIPDDYTFDTLDLKLETGQFDCGDLELKNMIMNVRYGDVNFGEIYAEDSSIKIYTGNCKGEYLETDQFNYENRYGYLKLDALNAQDAQFDGYTGDITVKNQNTTKANMVNKYGDINVSNLQCDIVDINVETGNIVIDQLNTNELYLKNRYGKVDLSDTMINSITKIKNYTSDIYIMGVLKGSAVISNEYGDITYETNAPNDEYAYKLVTKYGSIRIDNDKLGENVERIGEGLNQLDFNIYTGDIKVNFNK